LTGGWYYNIRIPHCDNVLNIIIIVCNCIIYRLDDDHSNKNLDGTGDDVFVSLDAFDMLTDFQELDILEHATQHASSMHLMVIHMVYY
jgi:hypothetical protein